MKDTIGLFSELGRRFNHPDAALSAAVDAACLANSWFTPSDVQRAMRAIADEMLHPEKLRAWLSAYPALPVAQPRNVLVVMAGNIPLVGFFDLLCVVVSGHRCLIKPSAKDTALLEYVVSQLRALDPSVAVEFYDETMPVDAVIATGSDNANRYFRARYADVPTLLRGHRQSVAVLSGDETPEQLAGLSDDIWAYSGLGCRNVSMIFAPVGSQVTLEVNAVNDKYLNNYRQSRALLSMTKQPFADMGVAVAVEQCEFPVALSCLSVCRYRSLDEVQAWLAAHDDTLQCVVSECVVHPRRVGFGRAQSPALTDYPDQRDVLAFLEALN